MKELDLWIFIYNKINRNLKVNLLLAINSSSSSISKSSFKMAVSEDIETYGSIGGGIMEYNILNEIRGTLTETEPVNIIRKLQQNTIPDSNSSGFSDSANQTLIVITLYNKHRDTIKNIIDKIEEQENGVLQINQNGLNYFPDKEIDTDISLKYDSDEIWSYQENIGLLNIVYIIGGNHVGLALSRIMSTLDFYVVTFDQREDIITMKQNTFSNQKIAVNFSEVDRYIKQSNKSYAVIITQNYDGDKESLKSIIGMNLKYIGMMGSDKYFKSISKFLEEEGISSDLFSKVNIITRTDIVTESPEEIAINIAANILNVKKNKTF